MAKQFLDYEGLQTYHKNMKIELDRKADKADLDNKMDKEDYVALTEEEINEILT